MTTTPRLILASESPYRRSLLDRLHLFYSAHAHRCDERALALADTLEDHALALATAKARSLADEFRDCFVLGSDQIAELSGEILHKPGNIANAREQLGKMQGKEHRLLTAIALLHPDGRVTAGLDVHRMRMRSLSEAEIERYLEIDEPFDCCGSYKIEGLGITLFESIQGDDFTAIMGLPLARLASLLRDAGFAVP